MKTSKGYLTDYTICDRLGLHWEWDGTRVFCVEAEEEFIADGIDVAQNGYPADTWAEAIKVLIDGGYIEPKKR
jgi:hypothetical protein